MATPVPEGLRVAAIVQIVVGVVDVSVGWVLASTMLGMAGCLLTSPCLCLGIPPPGTMCGMLGYLVLPLGVFEVVAGAVALNDPRTGVPLLKIASVLGICSVLFGALPSLIGGFIVQLQLQSPEVKGWLETPDVIDV